MQDGSYVWHISVIPAGKDPGSDEDMDFYSVQSIPPSRKSQQQQQQQQQQQYKHQGVPFETEPPTQGWEVRDYGRHPAPTVATRTANNAQPAASSH